jgi:hypothetical protein
VGEPERVGEVLQTTAILYGFAGFTLVSNLYTGSRLADAAGAARETQQQTANIKVMSLFMGFSFERIYY